MNFKDFLKEAETGILIKPGGIIMHKDLGKSVITGIADDPKGKKYRVKMFDPKLNKEIEADYDEQGLVANFGIQAR